MWSVILQQREAESCLSAERSSHATRCCSVSHFSVEFQHQGGKPTPGETLSGVGGKVLSFADGRYLTYEESTMATASFITLSPNSRA